MRINKWCGNEMASGVYFPVGGQRNLFVDFFDDTVIRTYVPETFDTPLGVLRANRSCTEGIGREVEILLRPDDIVPDDAGSILAKVIKKAFKGALTLYTLQLDSGPTLLSYFPSHRDHAIGDQVRVSLAAEHLICFPRKA